MLLHLLDLLVSPPHHLPDLFPVLWSLVGCGVICVAYLGTVWAMVKQTSPSKKQGKIFAAKSIPLVSILGGLLLSCPRESEGFLPPLTCCQDKQYTQCWPPKRESSSLHGTGGFVITQDLIDRARLPLEWERRNSQEAKPVLNLSAQDSDILSPANETKSLFEDDGGWMAGHLWQVTEQCLTDMGIPLRDETTQQASKLTSRRVLTVAPQLLRLPTSQIVEAARYLLSYPCGVNSTAVIEGDPSFLTYFADDLQYGLEEYLPNMMFMGNATHAAQMIETQLKLSPTFALQLIRLGVDGGLEERVSNQNVIYRASSSQTNSLLLAYIVSAFYRGHRFSRCREHWATREKLAVRLSKESWGRWAEVSRSGNGQKAERDHWGGDRKCA